MAEKYFNPLSDLGSIKLSLMSLFFNNDDIRKIIMPTSDDESLTLSQNWYGGTFDEEINGEAVTITLNGHCFDTPYITGKVSDGKCAVFIETYLTKAESRRIKEAGIDITVVCHKDLIALSDEDKNYFNSSGIYGNRIDSAIQLINSSIISHASSDISEAARPIGSLLLAKENPLKSYLPDTDLYGKSLSYTYQSFYRNPSNAG